MVMIPRFLFQLHQNHMSVNDTCIYISVMPYSERTLEGRHSGLDSTNQLCVGKGTLRRTMPQNHASSQADGSLTLQRLLPTPNTRVCVGYIREKKQKKNVFSLYIAHFCWPGVDSASQTRPVYGVGCGYTSCHLC